MKGPLRKAIEKGRSIWNTKAFGQIEIYDITPSFEKKFRVLMYS